MEKPNKRKADLERTRQIILSVASELFMTKGFKNTSTREIALKRTLPNRISITILKIKRTVFSCD